MTESSPRGDEPVRFLRSGAVYDVFAEYSPSGTPVSVLKVARVGACASGVARRLVNYETAMLARLRRPGLPDLMGADADGPNPWIRYRWIEGDTVARVGRGRGIAIARSVGAALLDHLAYLHRDRGIVHGDLCARNVLICGAPAWPGAAVIDFGNAWALARPWRRAPQAAYQAPEQVESSSWSMPADIFQAALVIHEIATGKRPAARTSDGVDPKLPRDWRNWLQRMLDPSPQKRPDVRDARAGLPRARWRAPGAKGKGNAVSRGEVGI